MWRPVQLEGQKQSLGYTGCVDPSEAKIFWAHAPPQGACEKIMCALELLATCMLVETTWWTRSSRLRAGLNHELRFIEVDNQEAVKIGLERNTEVKVVRLGRCTNLLSYREKRECFVLSSTPPMWEDNRWEPPLVDDDWHALCHAINMGEGVEWENLYYKFVEMTKESNIRREPTGQTCSRM